MKVWKDVDEVVKMIHELPNKKLRKTEKEMVSIPKFDKSKINSKNNDKLRRKIPK